jgi:dTDP-4-amino-4,6-dideoxygalactose transaminase
MSPVRIPILDLQAQFATIAPEVRAAVDRVLTSQHFILGEEVERFEGEAASYLGSRHAVGVASGSDALALALLALGIGPGDGVATPPLTYVATAEAVVRVGARPVFVDVDPDDLNLSPAALEAHFQRGGSPPIRAVIPVDLFGRVCDIEAISEIAHRYGAAVVEDACQAFGAAKGGRKAGTTADLGCYSFFPSKNLGGAGDGGLVVTDRDELAPLLRMLRMHGSRKRYLHERLGMNSRLDALQAAVLRVKLPHLDAWNAERRRHALFYREAFAGSALRCPPMDGDGRYDIFHLFVLRVPRRDTLLELLSARGIQAVAHYACPLHLQPCFASLGHRRGDFPECERGADEMLSIPIYPELPEAARAEIVSEVRGLLEGGA